MQALSWLLGRGMVMMTSAGSGWHSDTETRAHWARARGARGRRGTRYSRHLIVSSDECCCELSTDFLFIGQKCYLFKGEKF